MQWHQGEQTVTLSLEPEPVSHSVHLLLEGFPGLFLFHRLVDATSFSYISEGNSLPAFHPAASSCQQKWWFDTFTLCFWHLLDTGVSGSPWHSVSASMLPQAAKLFGAACWEGHNQLWVLVGHSARTASMQDNRTSCSWSLLPLHTRVGSCLSLCQGHSYLHSLPSLDTAEAQWDPNLSNCSTVPRNYSFCQTSVFLAVNCCIVILCS